MSWLKAPFYGVFTAPLFLLAQRLLVLFLGGVGLGAVGAAGGLVIWRKRRKR